MVAHFILFFSLTTRDTHRSTDWKQGAGFYLFYLFIYLFIFLFFIYLFNFQRSYLSKNDVL